MNFMKYSVGRVATVVACMALVGSFASLADAQPKWSEKTILKFDSPVMIPGATLQPGSYVFELADSRSNRNLMEVYRQDGHELVTTTMTVPTRRTDPNGDVVLKFADSADAEPVALKGFFYPGSLYGHEFVYTDAEAKQIAEKTHKVVLSKDVPGSDFERGTLHAIDERGQSTAWTANPDVARDWNVWIAEWRTVAPQPATGNRPTTTPGATGTSGDKTTAPAPGADTNRNADRDAMTPAAHAAAIQRLIDKALSGNSSTVTIDRSTLEQIRDHAAAIASSESGARKY